MATKRTFPAINQISLAEVKEILDSTGLDKFFRLDIKNPQPADRWQDLPGRVLVTDEGLYFRGLGKLVSNEECARALHLENQELSFRPPKSPKRLSQEELKRFISMKDCTSSTLLYTEFFDKPLKRWALIVQRRVLIRGAPSSIPSRAMRAVLETRDHPERVLGWWMWSMDRVRGMPFHVMALFVLNRSMENRPSVVDTQQSTTDPVQRQRGPVLETKLEFADEVEQEDEVEEEDEVEDEDEVEEKDEVEEEGDFILSVEEEEVKEKDEVEEEVEEEDDFILSIDDTLDNTQELKRKFEERQLKEKREKRQLVDLEEKLSKLKRKFQERRRQERRQLVDLEEKLSREKREKKQLEEKLSQAQREKRQLEEKLSQAPDVWKEANNELLEHVDRLRKHFHQVRRDIAEQMTKRVSIFDDVGEKMAKRVKRNEQCLKVPKREETDGFKTQFSSGQSSS